MACDLDEKSLNQLRSFVRSALRTYRDKNLLDEKLDFLRRWGAECVDVLLEQELADLQRVHAVPSTSVVDVPDGHLWYLGPDGLDEPSLRWNHFKEALLASGRSTDQVDSVDRGSTAI